jgi:hypothetical protein
MVPHQGGHPVSALQAGVLKRTGQGPRAAVQGRVGVAMQRVIGKPRNNFRFGKNFSGALQQMDQRERITHHGALHLRSFGRAPSMHRESVEVLSCKL